MQHVRPAAAYQWTLHVFKFWVYWKINDHGDEKSQEPWRVLLRWGQNLRILLDYQSDWIALSKQKIWIRSAWYSKKTRGKYHYQTRCHLLRACGLLWRTYYKARRVYMNLTRSKTFKCIRKVFDKTFNHTHGTSYLTKSTQKGGVEQKDIT